ARRDRMADEIRSGDSKVRVVRLLGQSRRRWRVGDSRLPQTQCRGSVDRALDRRGLPPRARRIRPLKTSTCPSSNFPTERAYSVLLCGMLPPDSALSPSPSCSTTSRFTVRVRLACLRPYTPPRKV